MKGLKLKWKEEYATGNRTIDDQHKALFNMVNDYNFALDDGDGERTYGVLLEFLDGYCRTHFNFEEECMEEHCCPTAQQNKDEHEALLVALSGYQQRYKTNGFSDTDARKLVMTLDGWLIEHICGVDIHLRNCMEK